MIEAAQTLPVPQDQDPELEPSRTVLDEMIDLWMVQTRSHKGPATNDEERHSS